VDHLRDLAVDRRAHLFRLRAVRRDPLQDVQADADRRERVAELMGEHAEELVLPPVRLAQRLLGFLAPGDVHEDADRAAGAPLGVEQRHRVPDQVAVPAVGEVHRELGVSHRLPRSAGDLHRELIGGNFHLVAKDAVGRAGIGRGGRVRPRLQPQQFVGAAVRGHAPAVPIVRDEDGRRHGVHDRLQLGAPVPLAAADLPERPLGRLRRADVGHEDGESVDVAVGVAIGGVDHVDPARAGPFIGQLGLEADELSAQRSLHVGANLLPGALSEDFADVAPRDLLPGLAEPVLVGEVRETVAVGRVDVGDQRRHGIGDDPQAAVEDPGPMLRSVQPLRLAPGQRLQEDGRAVHPSVPPGRSGAREDGPPVAVLAEEVAFRLRDGAPGLDGGQAGMVRGLEARPAVRRVPGAREIFRRSADGGDGSDDPLEGCVHRRDPRRRRAFPGQQQYTGRQDRHDRPDALRIQLRVVESGGAGVARRAFLGHVGSPPRMVDQNRIELAYARAVFQRLRPDISGGCSGRAPPVSGGGE